MARATQSPSGGTVGVMARCGRGPTARRVRLAHRRALVRHGLPDGRRRFRGVHRLVAVGHRACRRPRRRTGCAPSSSWTSEATPADPSTAPRARAAGRCVRAARDPGDRRELHGRAGHGLRGSEGRARPLPRHRRPVGRRGRVGIAGHRTTYQAPFFDLDDVRGATRSRSARYGTFGYEVDRVFVEPSAGWVACSTTCNPKYSSAERLIVTRAPRVGESGGPSKATGPHRQEVGEPVVGVERARQSTGCSPDAAAHDELDPELGDRNRVRSSAALAGFDARRRLRRSTSWQPAARARRALAPRTISPTPRRGWATGRHERAAAPRQECQKSGRIAAIEGCRTVRVLASRIPISASSRAILAYLTVGWRSDLTSLPLDRAWWLRRDVVGDPVHARHLADDATTRCGPAPRRGAVPSRRSSRPRW